MNFLQQVAPLIRIPFVRSSQPFKRWTKRRGGSGIPLFLAGRPTRIIHSIR